VPNFVDLQPGIRVKVAPPGDPLGVAFESPVRVVLPGALRLGLPRRDAEVMTVEPGDQLTMFTTVHGRVYRFSAPVRQVETDNDSFVIDPPREAEQTERRQFYRLPTRIVPRLATVLDDDGRAVQTLRGVILDLSGGGVLLQSRDFVEVGSRIRLVFELEGDPLEMDIGMLVLSINRPTTNAQQFRIHGQFLEPNRSEIERLVRYVYRQQAELRRKGLI